LPDRPRQRRLRDPEPLRRPPEMQLLGDGDEVPQLPRLHAFNGTAGTARAAPPQAGGLSSEGLPGGT
jgi:hypothetical protein